LGYGLIGKAPNC